VSTQAKNFLTPEQYLEIERKADVKSEYYQGEMFAMSGAAIPRNQITINVTSSVRAQLRGTRFHVFGGDMRVHVPATGLYTYPDAVAYCGEIQLLDRQLDTLLNPSLIVEVLSPATEAYDRGRKFEQYSSIDSFVAYLLIASDRKHVDLYTRQPDGKWLRASFSAGEDVIDLPCIGCQLKVAEIYEDVEFGLP
jgi:Uma2 family endonuclease